MLEYLFNKVGGLGLQIYYKETPTYVFSCEIGEIFKKSYFEEHLQTTASDNVHSSTVITTQKAKSIIVGVARLPG